MKCKRCGQEIQNGDQFCGNCGWKVEEKKTPVIPIVIGIIVVVILVVAGVFWYLHKQEQKKVEENLAKFQEKIEEDSQASTEDPADDQTNSQDAREENDADKEEEESVTDPTEGGIHRYEYIISNMTWTQACQECLNRGGYLVRINSREEYDYIISQLNERHLSNIQFKIGGRREANSKEYYWVDEAGKLYGDVINSDSYWCASEWMAGEPSYQDGATEEQYLDIFYHQNSGKWVWNDVPDDIVATVPEFSGKIGYICEYEE